MSEKLKTVVILSEERLRKEYRNVLGKLDCARIELEVLNSQNGLSAEILEEIESLEPQVFLVDLPQVRTDSFQVLSQVHLRFLNLPILAVGESYDSSFLIEALRLGVKEFIPRPINAEKLKEAYQRVHKTVCFPGANKAPATIFSFFSSKGGTGTTSIVANFAVSLSKLSKKKVLIADFEMQVGDIADYFGIKGDKCLFSDNSNISFLEPESILRSIITHPKTRMDILSLTNGYSRKVRPTVGEIKHLLHFLQRDYDYILIDTSNTFGDATVAALDVSDLIFLISKCNLPALRNTQKVLHVFERLGYSQSKVRIVINRYSISENISLRQVEKVLNFKIFWSIPNDFKSIIQSIQLGEPLTQRSESIPLAKSFYEMSAQVLGIQFEPKSSLPGGGMMVRSQGSAAQSLPFITLDPLKN